VTGVSLNYSSLDLGIGQTATLTPAIAPANATNTAVTWSSSDASKATVSNGLITAVAPGTATITVKTADGNKTATCNVTIVASVVNVIGVSLSPTSLNLTAGQTGNLTATVAPANATNRAVIWESSNPNVASVNGEGVVTASDSGTATITVRTADGNKTATCAVTVTIPVTGVSLSQTSLNLTVGGSPHTLTAAIAPANATNAAVTWSSSDTSKATVNNGVVTAVAPGTATITVRTADGNRTATCAVTVAAAAVSVTGVTLSPAAISLTPGGTQTLTATITPSNATNQAVTWSSNNAGKASVDVNGTVTAFAAGTATITVTTADGNHTATCAVTVTNPALTGTVTISGTAATGQTLTATIIDSNGSGARTIQWIRGESTNIGANQNTYVLVSDDVGSAIKVKVTYPAGFTGELMSAPTATVTAPALTGTVSVSNAQLGGTFTATISGSNGTGTRTVQWIRGASTNIGTNSLTYTPVAADIGNAIKVRVSYAGYTGTLESEAKSFSYAVSTVAGSGTAGYLNGWGDTRFSTQTGGMTIDSAGNLYLADTGNYRIRKITSAGEVITFAGGSISNIGDGTGEIARFHNPRGITIGSDGNFYVADGMGPRAVRKITPAGEVTTVINVAQVPTCSGGIVRDSAGNFYISATSAGVIIKITPANEITDFVGSRTVSGDTDGTGTAARFNHVMDIAIDSAGNLYAVDMGNNRIRKVTPAGVVTTFAGSSLGTVDGTGTAAQFNGPSGITIDSAGNFYVFERACIRKITPSGVVTTIAGSLSGETGYVDGMATEARFSNTSTGAASIGGGIVWNNNIIYVADEQNYRIRKIAPGWQ
jgi:uncharacterized protein YjdB